MTGARTWWPRAVVMLAAALVTVAVVAIVRSDGDPALDRPDTVEAATIGLAPSGLVVELGRLAPDAPVVLGTTTTFHVDVAATTEVAGIELWEDDRLVAAAEPGSGLSELGWDLEWTPTRPGTVLVTARATDTEGRVGLSNPVWTEVTGTTDAVAIDEVGRVVELRSSGRPAGFAGPARDPSPARAQAVVAPRLDVTVEGCTGEIQLGPAGVDGADRVVLLRVAAGSGSMVPVAESIADGSGWSLSLDAGTQAFEAAVVSDGIVRSWSSPSVTTVGDECATPGWEGPVTLVDGRLRADTAATSAYLYIEPEPGTWRRVPSTGTVPRTGTDFDFTAHLPELAGGFSISAWGWNAGELVHVGDGSYTPTPGATVEGWLPSVDYLLPPPTLVWIEQPASSGQPEVTSTAGVIDVDANGGLLGSYRLRWSNSTSAVTHGVLQVAPGSFPSGSGPNAVFTMFSCVIAGSGGEVEVDFDTRSCSTGDGTPPISVSASQQGTYGGLVLSTAGLGTPLPEVSEVDPLAQIEKQLYGPESPSDGSPAWTEQLAVRVVPMMSDSWTGQLTNDVVFEVDRTPKAPPGVPAYGMDVKLVTAPRAPDLRYANCWDVVGWKDAAAATAAAEQERAELVAANAGGLPWPPAFDGYLFWSELAKHDPICAPSCQKIGWGPGIGVWTVGLGGADCSSSSSFWSDPIGWFVENVGAPLVAVIKEMVNLVSNGFAKLKGLAVDGLMQITGCSGAFCKALAEAVVNGVLIAVGIPPTLPNFDQLVQLAEGEIVDLAVDLAKAAGVPCDEVGTAATLHGDEDLTCEGAVKALVDEVSTAVNQQFQQVAKAGGISFHPDLIIRPWWAGLPGEAVVDITVTPTKYSAEEQGVTCTAGALTSATWTATSTTQTIAGVGTAVIPQTTWQTMAYEIPSWRLPDLGKGTAPQPVTKRFTLAPPVAHAPVTVQQQVIVLAGAIPIPVQVSPYTFYFHQGATFALHVGSSCAGWETHTYTIDGSFDGALVSSEEGP